MVMVRIQGGFKLYECLLVLLPILLLFLFAENFVSHPHGRSVSL